MKYKTHFKKKTITLLFILFTSIQVNAQLLNESFETVGTFPPIGWARFRTGPGTTFQWNTATGGSGGASSQIAVTFLESSGSGVREKWLVTPQLTPIEGNKILNFKSRRGGVSPAFANLSVRISTASQTTVTDFTTVQNFAEGNTSNATTISTTLSDFSVDLTSYLNQYIYIAFV